jgi:beta-lactamase class A
MAVERRTFLAGIAASALVLRPGAFAARAADANSPLARAVAHIPGDAAVYARPVDSAAPLLSIDASAEFPAASVIKLWIMLVVYRAVDAGEFDLSRRVSIARHDIVGGSETFGSASAGQAASLAALVRAMITQSDNTAANALVRFLGFERLNREIRQAGFPSTRLQRYFMYFPSPHENLTSASDTGRLLLGIARGARGESGSLASGASCRAMVRTLLGQEDREKIAPGLPAGTPLANKTGELPGVRHDAGIVDPFGSAPYVLVVLEKNLSDQERGVAGINRISAIVHGLLAPSKT